MKNRPRLLIIMALILGVILLWAFDVFQYISIDRIRELTAFINGFGWLAPVVFIMMYVAATVLFLPGLPLTLLAGIVFGPVLGTLWVSIASTTGATLAFIIGRYTGRGFIVDKFSSSELFIRLDKGIKEQGWKMVAITRLVPLFPFNAQNYVYGLTDVSLRTYAFVSWICMLPATVAYTFLAGSVIAGEGDVAKTVTYIGVGVALLIALSAIGKSITKRQKLNKEANNA